MGWCENASVINGKQQESKEFAHTFAADSCDYQQVGDLEYFDGTSQQVAPRVRNCGPDVTKELTQSLTWSATVNQISGRYEMTRQGTRGSLFGVLNGYWMKHQSSRDLTEEKVTAKDTNEVKVPPGKILTIYWTPKMQRMTGKWVVTRGVDFYEAPEATEGPAMLAAAPGGTPLPNGYVDPVLEDCPA